MRNSPAGIVGGLAGLVAALLLNLHPLPLIGQGVAHQFREVHLGMEVSITAHGDPHQVERAAAAAFARIGTLEQVLSDWRPTSELNRVAAAAAEGAWQPISADLESVLQRALELAAASDGAFDPTIGALTRSWREARRTGIPTDPRLWEQLRRTVDWRRLQLDTIQHRLRLGTAGTLLDLGGIAKGWILDAARATMAEAGITTVLIEAGGDLVAGDAPEGSPGWRVNVRAGGGDSVIVIQRAALATSGPSAQAIADAAGQRQSHVIDPTTGHGLHNGIEVTVMASDGATADAVATALTVMPRTAWAGLMDRFGVKLVAVVNGEW